MTAWGKILAVSLPLALLLTAAFRFIQHTDREYAQSISVYAASAARLEARCAELKTPGVCATARERGSFVAELENYHNKVMAWWWPTLVTMLLAWMAAGIPLFWLARRFFRRRSAGRA